MTDTTTQDYVPADLWPTASTMLEGFGAPSLPQSEALAGTTITVEFEGGMTVEHVFHDVDRLTWTVTQGAEAGESGTHSYRAVEVRPSLFFIDFQKGEGTKQHSISLVCSLADGNVTVADTSFVNRAGEVRTHTDFVRGRIAGTGQVEPLVRSTALVGKRIYYRYSETEAYEHVYFNAGTVAWQCVKGGERGLADVEQIKVFELDDDIVIYFWTETVLPVDSFLLVDLRYQRSIGRMYFWEQTTLEPVHLPFDSNFTVLNETVYPED